MKGKVHLLLPAAAVLFQAVPPLFLRYMSAITYGPSHAAHAAWERPLSLLGMAGCAALSLFLGAAGAYFLLTRSRRFVAAPLILCCCFPALLAGAGYLHALLVFLTLL